MVFKSPESQRRKGRQMPNYNKVFLMGNLTRDPELRFTPSGTAVAQFGLAVNRRSRAPDGTQREETLFIEVEVWGRQAETASQYLAKGRSVFVEGRLRLETWESQDGQKRSRIKVVADTFQFLTPKAEAQEETSAEEEINSDDDVPF